MMLAVLEVLWTKTVNVSDLERNVSIYIALADFILYSYLLVVVY